MKITVQDLSFQYHSSEPYAVKSFSETFSEKVYLLNGFSGCGKTTLLRLLAGYLKPTNGSIEISGYGAPNKSFIRNDLGFVFQQNNLLPLASVKRNLQIAASFHRGKETEHEIEKMLSLLGLEEFAKVKAHKLSGGQSQRATIARALIKKPKVLLFDEPTSGLDDLNTELIKSVLANYSRKNKCIIIISTHDVRLKTIADEIIDFNKFLPIERHLESLVRTAD